MPRKLWPSSRPRGTLSGNGYRKEQLVRGHLWLTLGKKHEQWYRSKIRRVSPFSCFRGQFGSGNNTVTSALCTAPAGESASCKLGAALRFCGLSLEGEDYGGATTWSLAGLIKPSSLKAGLTWVVLAWEQKEQCQGTQPWYRAIVQLHESQPCSGTASTQAA